MKKRISREGFSLYALFVFIGILFSSAFHNTCSAQSKTLPDNYNALIQQADQALAAKDYATALFLFDRATNAKPELTYARDKINQINALLNADASLRPQLFENIIIKAENLYKLKQYPEAKAAYQQAVLIDPEARFPKDRLAEIRLLYTDPEDEAYFKDAVANGDKALLTNAYDKALKFYETALGIKPEAGAIKDKIATAAKQRDAAIRTREQSEQIIAGADQLLQSGKRTEARAEYQKALAITPGNNYISQKIQEIDNYDSQVKLIQETYDKAIDQADKFYLNRDFASARLKYQEALKAKPGARYPKEMLEKAKTGETQLQSDQQQYEAALASAEAFLKSGDTETALNGFKSASALMPGEAYPKTKIAEIESLLNKQNDDKQAYEKAIQSGDQAFDKKKYDIASGFYQNALSLQPGAKYPADKLNEIAGMATLRKSQEVSYKNSLSEADQLFEKSKFAEAITAYYKCLEIKPDETYPQQRIAEAQQKITSARDKETNYAAAIAEGDKQFSEQKYDEALAAFKQAASVKPAEKYPENKIAEINRILSKLKADQDKYTLAIQTGDKALGAGNLTLALASFKEALALQPDQQYAKEKISEVNNLLAAQLKNNEVYATTLKAADQLYDSKEYERARVSYAEALALKKNESYPAEQISRIDKIIEGQRSAEENYNRTIAEADQNFNNRNYPQAITFYQKALSQKPSETYPKSQVDKANALIAAQKKQDDEYLSALTVADQHFENKDYPAAITEYKKALEIKSSETYPAEKIAASEKEITLLQARQETYNTAMAEGEKQYALQAYENALAAYKKANATLPAEKLPAQKIAEIQTILDKINANNQRYDKAIATADQFYSTAKYREALEPYQTASTLKPGETYPQQQIERINQKLAEQKKIDDDYQQLIADAATKLSEGNYDASKTAYARAGTLKPLETLPKEKIAEIEGILAAQKRLDENYGKTLQTAAELYTSKDLQGAVKAYQSAQLLKPAEKFPQERIQAIEAEIKVLDDNYLKFIALGDSKLASENLAEALNAYQEATQIKPGEAYPKNKISEINRTLAAQKEEQEKMYTAYVSEGNKLAAARDYNGAISSYTEAAGIKPAETYPAQRIAELKKINEELELARRAEYNKALGEADKLYNTKIFDLAIDAYEAASLISPNDPYPGQQIDKIRKYMTDHAIQDLDSQTLLISAGSEKKFSFSPVEPRLRKNNYILLKARSAGDTAPKVYLNYGKDGQKNGGIVIRSLDKTSLNDYIIRISVQDKWYREDNNWISLFVETGAVEITKVQIAAGD